MSEVILSTVVMLDGVMEAPGGGPGHPHSGWARGFMGCEPLRYKLDEALEAQSLLIGRVTYESFAAAWRRLFPETLRKTVLRLADTRMLDPGVVVQTYRRVSGRIPRDSLSPAPETVREWGCAPEDRCMTIVRASTSSA